MSTFDADAYSLLESFDPNVLPLALFLWIIQHYTIAQNIQLPLTEHLDLWLKPAPRVVKRVREKESQSDTR
jgi:hypothetical protein